MHYGLASVDEAIRLTDDRERPASIVGTVGGAAGWARGAAYEHNTRLAAHSDRCAAFRKVMTCGPVVSAREIWRNLVHIPTYVVEPADESPQAVRNADHVKACLGIDTVSPIGTRWASKLDELLTYEDYGFGLWEAVPVQVGGVWYTPLAYRDPASIYAWVLDANGKLCAAEQMPVSGYAGLRTIPMSQAFHMVARPQSADDFSGVGLLRPVEPYYAQWVALNQLALVAAQRWAVATPTGRINVETARLLGINVDEAWELAQRQALVTTLQKYTAADEAYMIPPAWVELGEFGGKVDNLSAIDAMIGERERRMSSVYSSQWMMLGTTGSGGTQALSTVQVEAQRDNVSALVDRLLGNMGPYITRAVRWQFGEQEPAELMPHIRADGLGSEAFAEYLAQIPALVSADAIRPDDGMRDALRRTLELPEEDPDNRPPAPRPAARPFGSPVLPNGVARNG